MKCRWDKGLKRVGGGGEFRTRFLAGNRWNFTKNSIFLHKIEGRRIKGLREWR